MINLIWLQTFCTLVETRHFTRTAEKLAMTQPGVTQHIQKLEQYLGHTLLHREGKSFQLTETGEQVYRQGRITLNQLNTLEHSLKTDDPFSGRCRLASPGSVGLKLYPLLLDHQAQHPDLEIDFAFAPNSSIESDLEERHLDLGLITKPVSKPGLTCSAIASEDLCLVTHKSITSVDWKTLINLGYINHPDGAHHASLLLNANFAEFETLNQLPQRGFSNQIGLILEPVSRGLGFTVLPAHAVEAFPRQSLIHCHELPEPVSESIYLAQRKWHTLPARLKKLIEVISSSLQNREGKDDVDILTTISPS